MGTDHDGKISQARLSFQAETPSGGSRSIAMSLLLISSSMTLMTSEPMNSSTSANTTSPRSAKTEASFEPGSFCMALDIALVGRTIRIRRRRAQDVADTTDCLRAVACIRFVRCSLFGEVDFRVQHCRRLPADSEVLEQYRCLHSPEEKDKIGVVGWSVLKAPDCLCLSGLERRLE